MLTPGNLNSVTANISDQSETENCYVSVMEETAFITESGLELEEEGESDIVMMKHDLILCSAVLSTAALTDDLTTAATVTCSTQDVFTDVYTDQNLNQWENIKYRNISFVTVSWPCLLLGCFLSQI